MRGACGCRLCSATGPALHGCLPGCLLGYNQGGGQPGRAHAEIVGDRGERRAGGVDAALAAQGVELIERELGRIVGDAELVTRSSALDWRAADLLAAADPLPVDPLAAADLLAAGLLAAAGLVAVADGAGLPDDVPEPDAKAAVGTAIAVAATTAATARRWLRADMTRSFWIGCPPVQRPRPKRTIR